MNDDALFAAYSIGRHTVRALVLQLKDAADFESKVAAKLADRDFAASGASCELCPFCGEDNCSDTYLKKYHHTCMSSWARMKEARIAVEEEMDENG